MVTAGNMIHKRSYIESIIQSGGLHGLVSYSQWLEKEITTQRPIHIPEKVLLNLVLHGSYWAVPWGSHCNFLVLQIRYILEYWAQGIDPNGLLNPKKTLQLILRSVDILKSYRLQWDKLQKAIIHPKLSYLEARKTDVAVLKNQV